MENLIEKSDFQIKDRIEFWFFKYYNKSKADFNGKEVFTLFELLDDNRRKELVKRLNLNETEIPVLVLRISDSKFIINTTNKFVRINNATSEFINYSEFERHIGYKSIVENIGQNQKQTEIKTDNYLADFGLKIRGGDVIFWEIPTGKAGFGFWNVTKKCELIGRKFTSTK